MLPHRNYLLHEHVSVRYRIKNREALLQTKIISLEIGRMFQVQDDYLDCFGNPQTTGKIGTDIEENKCTWFAVNCLQRANYEQKQELVKCYGKHGYKHTKFISD